MAIKRKMPQTVVNAQNWRVPMKKKIGLMFLMLISLILVMGGTAFAKNCEICGDTFSIKFYESQGNSGHKPYYQCNSGCTSTGYYGSLQSHSVKTHAQGSTYPETRCGYKSCSRCSWTDGWNHTWSISSTTSATCTEAGTITYVCSNNKHTSTVTGDPATGHSYTSSITKSATCTSTGTRTYTCSKCGDSYTETISATGHSYGSWQTYTSGTCQTPSVERRYCINSGCSSYESRAGSYGSHNYSQSCPTCGTANVKCSICGDIKSHTCLQAPTVTMKLSDGTSYNETWTNKSVTVTLSATGATNYQYSTNGTTWQAITGLTMNGITGTVTYSDNMNSKMYFRTVKGSTYSGATSAHNIKIDKTAPSGTININKVYGKYVNSNEVTIKITFTDNYSTASEMKIALINSADFSESKLNSSIVWEEYVETKSFTLTEGEGIRKVYAIFKDAAGNQSVYLVQ